MFRITPTTYANSSTPPHVNSRASPARKAGLLLFARLEVACMGGDPASRYTEKSGRRDPRQSLRFPPDAQAVDLHEPLPWLRIAFARIPAFSVDTASRWSAVDQDRRRPLPPAQPVPRAHAHRRIPAGRPLERPRRRGRALPRRSARLFPLRVCANLSHAVYGPACHVRPAQAAYGAPPAAGHRILRSEPGGP